MTAYDLFLVSPYLALAALAMLVIVADLVTRRTGLLVGLSFVGLAAPAALSAWQMVELTGSGANELTAEGSVILYTLSIDRFRTVFQLPDIGGGVGWWYWFRTITCDGWNGCRASTSGSCSCRPLA